MKDIALVGLPSSGKSTLFTALTRAGASGGRSNQAVVDVPDERLDVLARLERSRRVVSSKVRFADVPGGLTAQGLAEGRKADALCIVLGAFVPDADAASDLQKVVDELVLADLASIESGVERARKKARGSAEGKAELAALEAAFAVLEQNTMLRDATLEEEVLRALRSYGALTLKPWIVVANVAEDAVADPPPPGLPDDALAISAALESEVAGLEPDDAAEMLAGFGISEPGLRRVIAACYRTLDLITFLTTGEDETRAWEVRRGARAPEAAGAIHSDLQRGFIRAEVVAYDDLVGAGSWDAAKAQGHLRVEGKDYLVREGDVVHVRFAV